MSRLGALRHRLSLQREARTADGGGGFARTWSTYATVWGEVRPLSGTERLRAERLENPVTYRVRIRHRDDVDAADRILSGVRAFRIVSLRNPDERGRFIESQAIEGTAI